MHRIRVPLAVALLFACGFAAEAAEKSSDKKVRLFILSGQSNMAGLDPNASFTPAVTKAFADDGVIVVKHAVSGHRSVVGITSGNCPKALRTLRKRLRTAISTSR